MSAIGPFLDAIRATKTQKKNIPPRYFAVAAGQFPIADMLYPYDYDYSYKSPKDFNLPWFIPAPVVHQPERNYGRLSF